MAAADGPHPQKKSLRASEQSRPDVAEARRTWPDRLRDACGGDYARVVCVDEFGAATDLTRTRGRADAGARCPGHAPRGHWKVMTGLVAVRPSGVAAAMTIDCPADADVFRAYAGRVLAPALSPGDVVVIDNLPAHKAPGVAEAVAAAGASVLYLPPYSPDLHPIEMVFSKVKRLLREAAARTVDALHDAVADALDAITPADITGCYRHCRYEQ